MRRCPSRIRAITLAFLVASLLATVAPAMGADVKSDLLAMHEAMVKAGKFRTRSTITSGDTTMKHTVETIWPDRFHMIMLTERGGGRAQRPSRQSERMEVIILPGHTYIKQAGAWQPFPADLSQLIEGLRAEAIKKSFEGISRAKDLGDRDIDGHVAHGYEYDSSVRVIDIDSTAHVQMWVDRGTRLPVHRESDDEAIGRKSHTVQDYEFDPSIRIDPPI